MRARKSRPIALGIMGLLFVALSVGTWFAASDDAAAEYGDVIINNYSDDAAMRPVIFPHWFHRIRFRCKVCHADLGDCNCGEQIVNLQKLVEQLKTVLREIEPWASHHACNNRSVSEMADSVYKACVESRKLTR